MPGDMVKERDKQPPTFIKQRCKHCERGWVSVINPDNLRYRRLNFRMLSLRAMARTIGVSVAYLSLIERGLRPCPRRVWYHY